MKTQLQQLKILCLMLLVSSIGWGQTELLNEELRDGILPTDWSQIDVSFQTAAGGYARLDELTSELTTLEFDASSFASVEVETSVAKFSSGTDGPVTIEYSLNGGDDWAIAGTTSTPTGSTYIDDTTVITEVSETMVIRFSRPDSPSQKRLRDIVVNGLGGAGLPTLLTTPSVLSDFTYIEESGPSSEQSISVSGSNLDGSDVTVSLPASSDFELAETASGTYTNSITLATFDGTATDVFVRLKSDLNVGTYADEITISGGGASPITVDIEGEVFEPVFLIYDFIGETVAPAQSPNNATTSNFGISAGSVGFGTTGTWAGSGTPYAEGSGGWGQTNVENAKNFNFNVEADSGFVIDVSNISFEWRTTGVGPSAITLEINGVEVATFNSGSNAQGVFIESLSGFENLSNLEVVIKGWDNGSRSTSGNGDFRINDVRIDGEVREASDDDLLTPVLSLASDTYFEDQTVFISNFEDYGSGVQIFYTLDGTEPTSSSLEYDNTLGILLEDGNGEVTLSAIAIDGAQESNVVTRTYTFPINVADIETLRAQSTGSTIYRVANEATLIGQTAFRNTKFFQDDSGFGIQIDDASGIITSTYDLNDNVASLVGTLGVFLGQLQFVPSIDFGAAVSSGNTVTPLTRTLDDLGFDDQARLVVVENVLFTNSDGINTFGAGGFDTPINDGTTGNYRNIFGESNITGAIIPEYEVNIVGVIQQNNSGFNLGARNLEDITPTADFFFSDGAWSPSNPVGTSTDTHNILIADGSVDITSTLLANNLEVATGATLNVTSSGVLDLAGNIINNGNLVFQSDANGSGQLAEFTGTITGDVRVERYIPKRSDNARAFRFLSSAVNASSIEGSWQQDTHITGSTDGSNGFDATLSGAPSMFDWNGTDWQPIANTTSALDAGKAYRLYVRGDRSVTLEDNNGDANDVTLSATGELVTGSFSVTGVNTSTEGYSFVGNPYQAVVDLGDSSLYGSGVNSSFASYWDPTLADRGAFVIVDIDDNSLTVDSPGSSNANKFLQPGQAVFFRNNETAGDFEITFNEASKAVTEPQTEIFSTNSTPFVNIRLYEANRYANGGKEQDATGIRFHSGDELNLYSNAGKMGNSSENIAFIYGNELTGIKHDLHPENGQAISMFVNNYQHQDYLLWLNTNDLPEGTTAYLKDNYTDELIELESGVNEYAFEIDPSINESINNFRFELQFDVETFSDNNFESDQFSFYPNPAQDNLFIKTPFNVGDTAEISIFDLNGRLITKHQDDTNNSSTLKIDVSNLNSGVYFVEVKGNQVSSTLKLIKK